MAVAPRTKLFGTDGVRGVAGEFLTAELAFALGRAGAAVCDAPSPQVPQAPLSACLGALKLSRF